MTDSEVPSRSDRFDPEEDDEWARSPFERDRDRILYARELRRLKDVTQVARAGESYLYHDRLSHSLKVAQVGRGLATILSKRPRNTGDGGESVPNSDVVEAACLAHDLGHPPFGHLSEQALDEKLRVKTDPDRTDGSGENELEEWMEEEAETIDPNSIPMYGYEGNAQSFRIVTRLAAHYKSNAGLNLTHATLNALLKYPHSREENDDKWGYYASETDRFEWAREGRPEGKSLEAEIMDYADDVTYAIHDVVDFYKGGLIPLGQLLGEAIRRGQAERLQRRRKDDADQKRSDADEADSVAAKMRDGDLPAKPTLDEFETHVAKSDEKSLRETTVEEFFRGLSTFPGVQENLLTPFQGTDEESRTLSRLSSNLVSRYLNAGDQDDPEFVFVSDDRESGGNCLYIDRRFREQVWILKELTFYYVINNATLVGQQRGERTVIEELFDALYEEADRDDLDESAIPSPYRDWLQADPPDTEWTSPVHRRARIVADMVATMTEPQAITLHKRLTGDTPGSLQNEIVR